MNNGFFVAEIISRYHPLKIQMHSFDNSQNYKRKKNNWFLIQEFFTKNEIDFGKINFEKLMNNEFEEVQKFFTRLYEILTQKK